VTAPERETAGAVRSAHVAYFLPPDWGRIARILTPSVERLTAAGAGTGLLVVVPDGSAALGLARALGALPAAASHRIAAVTTSSRGKRLLAGEVARIVIGAPSALAPVLQASALKLDQVGTLAFVAADELDADDADLAAILAEVPRAASRVLTATTPNPADEALLERHLHRARRVTEDLVAAPGDHAASQLRFVSVGGSPVDAIPAVLDEVDAPSATIVTADPRLADDANRLLTALGYAGTSLASVSDGAVEANTTLVLFLGVPTGSQWGAAVAATPAHLVAIVSPRDRAALELVAAPAPVRPFVARGTLSKARSAEARARAELRDMLSEGMPAREILALEPLLVEHDGLEIAAAALRLLDRTRGTQQELVREAEKRVRAEMNAAAAAAAPAESRGPLPFRSDRPRGDRPQGDRPRGPRSDAGPRGPRSDAGPRGPRRDDDRGPRGPRRDDDRGPRPPRRDDDRGPRPPRRDDDRGPRGPRGVR
jgi:ATP-dependent RNA helicase DeaD